MGTGASRHVCPPANAGGASRPTNVTVETANGTVRATGEVRVHVPGLGASVSALVMGRSPCLLSVGQLVRQGYQLQWSSSSCVLRRPSGEAIPLRIVCGIPVVPYDTSWYVGADQAGRGGKEGPGCIQRKNRRGARGRRGAGPRRRSSPDDTEERGKVRVGHAHAQAVREGVCEDHRQYGHYPWRPDCSGCCSAAMRSQQHRRQLPHAGTLAVDIVSASAGAPTC